MWARLLGRSPASRARALLAPGARESSGARGQQRQRGRPGGAASSSCAKGGVGAPHCMGCCTNALGPCRGGLIASGVARTVPTPAALAGHPGDRAWHALGPKAPRQLAPCRRRAWAFHAPAPSVRPRAHPAAWVGDRCVGQCPAALAWARGSMQAERKAGANPSPGSCRPSNRGTLRYLQGPLALPAAAARNTWHAAAAVHGPATTPGGDMGGYDPLPLGMWPGLPGWRQGGLRQDWIWGLHGPLSVPAGHSNAQGGQGQRGGDMGCSAPQRDDGQQATWEAAGEAMLRLVAQVRAEIRQDAGGMTLPAYGRLVLSTPCVDRKLAITRLAMEAWETGSLPVGASGGSSQEPPPCAPELPEKPPLVHPRRVPKPGKKSPLPLAAHLLHTLAHVELNAVHLAWDTAVRFAPLSSQLGRNFFGDFLRVADDEARHFGWCQQRLRELGFSYGDMPAHNLLWVDCEKSAQRVENRLAVISMVQEARGLDAGPRLVQRLVGAGDSRSAGIVARICEEEMAHVAVGVAWFAFICQQLNADAHASFKRITKQLSADGVKGPFNHEARESAGLPRCWYDDAEASADLAVPECAPREQLHADTLVALQDAGSREPGRQASPLELQDRLASMLAMEEELSEEAASAAFRAAR